MTHYICTGTCGGVSETPGVCHAALCPLHGKPLVPCDCIDGKHYGVLTAHAKKVLLLVAQKGFQSKEYFDTKYELENAGTTVVTAAPKRSEAVSHMGEGTTPDLALSEVKLADYNGVFAIGGPGALEYLDNEETARIYKEAQATENYPYGAICISPRILAKAGVLTGRRATGWDNDDKLQDIFDRYGVIRVKEPVVVDGIVITADGPATAHDFGKKIVEIVGSKYN